MKKKDFAAFIMTYERPEILLSTIQSLQAQTFTPSFIYIVDNSETDNTERAIKSIERNNIEYFRVGFNSGPAGAAHLGLEALVQRGYKWIYWGDDDNPPFDKWVFERQFKALENFGSRVDEIGIIGGKGGLVNKITGRIETFDNKKLKSQHIIEVDSVPGGGSMLVNAAVVKEGILPMQKLFFGFEELDFCIRVKKNGYKVIVNSDLWLAENVRLGYTEENFRWKDSNFGKKESLWRDYYSTRNLLHIYFKNGYFTAFTFILSKYVLKSFLGWKFGSQYGLKNFQIQWQAIIHFFRGVYGRGFRRNMRFYGYISLLLHHVNYIISYY